MRTRNVKPNRKIKRKSTFEGEPEILLVGEGSRELELRGLIY